MRSFGICNLSIIPVRSEASDRSEIMTQMLFGDHFEILEMMEKWAFIRTAYDDYEGWIDPKQFMPIDEKTYLKLNNQQVLTGLAVTQPIKTAGGEVINTVPGSVLPFYADGKFKINTTRYEFSGDTLLPDSSKFASGVEKAAKFYLHTPYLWGGKSTFGIDCSGLTQMVFKHFGVVIKRDARQQAEQGKVVGAITDIKLGDLAFFDNAEGRVTHVGILLDKKTIIHASGRVKIDAFSEQGIYSKELGRYTHKLKSVKRFI